MAFSPPEQVAGDSQHYTVVITNPGTSTPFTGGIAGWEIWFVAKTSYTQADVDAPIWCTTTNGLITITDAPNSECEINVPPAATEGLQAAGASLVWDLQVLTDTDDIYTVERSNATGSAMLELVPGATRASAAGPPMLPVPMAVTSPEERLRPKAFRAARRAGTLQPFRQVAR
jgi:hypothetical protein